MALAIDASSPAAVTATTTTKATASFTPPANSLVVAMAVCGDTNGTGSDTGTVTDSLSSTWTLKKRINTAGDGSAQIYMMDAGGSPAARTVTVTGTDSGVHLAVLVFTGAAVTASQTGTNVSASSTTFAISVTPTATGSYLVGCLCQSASGVALTVNANSTTLLSTNDASNGETYGSFRSTSTTASLSAVSVGYTNTSGTAVQIVALEVLASTVTSTPISNGDTGSGADAGTLLARVSSADIGTGADAASLAVTLAGADTGSAVDTARIAVSSGDTGTAVDNASVNVPVGASDTGALTDAAALNVTVTASDVGTGLEAGIIRLSAGDAGTGVDTPFVGVPVSASDSGTLTDAVAALSATLTASDTGTGLEAGTLNRTFSDGDTGTATEGTPRIAFSAGDSGTAIDTATVSNAVLASDTGTFTETTTKAFATGETGTLTEGASVRVGITAGDFGVLVDAVKSIVTSGQFFRTPTVIENHVFHARVSRQQSVGVTILKKSGSYTAISDPTAEQVGTADIAYLGGRDYRIDDTEKAALVAAGYGSFIITKVIP